MAIQDYLAAMKVIFDLEKRTPEQVRTILATPENQAQVPPGSTVDKIMIGNLPAEWVRADSVPVGNQETILYFHGGGFFCGNCATHRGLAAGISQASGIRVLTVEYRLAPEHKYPAANYDALAAYRWLIAGDVAAANIVIGGDSAGGGLALMTLLALRDAGEPLPAAAFMIAPWTDLLNFDGESYTSRAELDPICTLRSNQIAAQYYIGGTTAKPPELSPVNCCLGGLPPLLVQVSDHDILLSDSTRLAERARVAGVDVTLEIWDNMWHVFHHFAAIVPEAKQAINNIGYFARKHIG